jgi:hypothetical protein
MISAYDQYMTVTLPQSYDRGWWCGVAGVNEADATSDADLELFYELRDTAREDDAEGAFEDGVKAGVIERATMSDVEVRAIREAGPSSGGVALLKSWLRTGARDEFD